ncbi:MAG: hypothetical protein HOH66_06505, partial [Rhodospirillaceae bacterium]|nr:hypothetical protein [Rhodospirillaceae bacterium]
MAKPIEILGLCGSLRKNSYNRAALRAAQEMAAPDARIEIAEIGAIPLYDDDLREADWPEAAALLCRRIEAFLAELNGNPGLATHSHIFIGAAGTGGEGLPGVPGDPHIGSPQGARPAPADGLPRKDIEGSLGGEDGLMEVHKE